jgi:signal transduction histidine kinase
MRRRWLSALAIGACGFGLLVEWLAARSQPGWDDPARWLPDLLVGLALVLGGAIAADRRPASRIGLLMWLTGAAWFAGTAAVIPTGSAGWAAAVAIDLHRAVLAQTILSFPSGRLAGPVPRASAAGAYALAFLPPALAPVTTIGTAAIVGGVPTVRLRTSGGRERPSLRAAALAGWALALVLAVGTVARLLGAAAATSDSVLLLYEITIVAVAAVLLVALLRSGPDDVVMVDLVVDLQEHRSGTLQQALAEALGDPTLEVGYWQVDIGAYVSDGGIEIRLPSASDARRSATRIDRNGAPSAVIVHEAAVLDDAALLAAVAMATRLAEQNVRLHSAVEAEIAAVRASRRRLVLAQARERRRLAERLRRGPEHRLLEVAASLAPLRSRAGDEAFEDHLQSALALLGGAVDDLRRLGSGLQPSELGEQGLEAAVRTLAARSPVPIRVTCARPSNAAALPPAIEEAAYFVCLEGVTNAVKHGAPAGIDIDIGGDDVSLRVEVRDDGTGGAQLRDGTGLRGLAERVGSVGGSLTIESPPGGGTRLVAELRLDAAGKGA